MNTDSVNIFRNNLHIGKVPVALVRTDMYKKADQAKNNMRSLGLFVFFLVRARVLYTRISAPRGGEGRPGAMRNRHI